MSRAIIKNGLCDAFEVLGGCTNEGNNMQVALYNQLRTEGENVPIVGSSDSHSVLTGTGKFNKLSTVAFADGDVVDAVSEGYSVAVESIHHETVRVYGDWSLVAYTHFLLRNYFPVHDELCFASGLFTEAYIHGDEGAKEMIEKTENRILEYEKTFFGR